MTNRRICPFTTAFLCCCLWTTIAATQSTDFQAPHFSRHRLSIDPVPFYWGSLPLTSEYSITYERRWSNRQQSGLRLSLIGFNTLVKPDSPEAGERRRGLVRANGYSAGAFHKLFLGETRRKNWYIAPELSYFYTHYADQKSDDAFTLRKLRTALRFGREQLIFGRITFDWALGLALNIKNYAWEKLTPEQPDDTGQGTVNKSWGIGWGLVQRPAAGLGFPINVRLGYQF